MTREERLLSLADDLRSLVQDNRQFRDERDGAQQASWHKDEEIKRLNRELEECRSTVASAAAAAVDEASDAHKLRGLVDVATILGLAIASIQCNSAAVESLLSIRKEAGL